MIQIAKKTALVRHCSRLFVTGANLTIPHFTVVLRKAYGLGAQAMAGGSFKEPFFAVAWPTGERRYLSPRIPPTATTASKTAIMTSARDTPALRRRPFALELDFFGLEGDMTCAVPAPYHKAPRNRSRTIRRVLQGVNER